MQFEIVGPITNAEAIAAGPGVPVRSYLRKAYGQGPWRKMKGIATIRLPNGAVRTVELHWYGAWDRQEGFENQALRRPTMKAPTKTFALCLDNTGYRASLIPGKVYRIHPDPEAAKDDLVRIVDESDEDYLYHKSHFVFVDFPPAIKKKILALQYAA